MKSKRLFFEIAFIVLSGCSAYKLQPLDMNHPANAQAMTAPLLLSSKTLTYSRADKPTVSAATTPRGGHQDHHSAAESNAQKTVVGEGKVIATVPSANQIVVEHGAIPGFMDAMTMGYPVQPSSLLEGLKSGDQVRFTIDVPNKRIVKIENIK